MADEGYVSVYTTYVKANAVSVISALRGAGRQMIYRTSAETGSDDVLYEVCVPDSDVPDAHEIIISLKLD